MKNLKPLDVKEALAGKAVMIRDGRKAYVRYHETELPVDEAIRLTGFRADGYQLTWCENGDYYASSSTSEYDIIGMYPQTRIINGFEVSAPETKEPECGTPYYLATPSLRYFNSYESWDDNPMHKIRLERGLVFLNVEDAVATSKAMLGIDPQDVRAEE